MFTRITDHACAEFCKCKKRTQTGYGPTTRIGGFVRDHISAKAGKIETRGRPHGQTEKFLIDTFVEVEARSRAAGLSVKKYLDDSRMMWAPKHQSAGPASQPHQHSRPSEVKEGRWDSKERHRVRKAHGEGKREACWYCCSYNAITRQPQYLWHDFMRRIELRQAELLAGPKSEFFVLTIP